MAVKYQDSEITASKLIDFARGIFKSQNQALEVKSEPQELEEKNLTGKLVGLNIFKEVMRNKNKDLVVLFYRSGLRKDRELLSEYLEFTNAFHELEQREVLFYHYDVERNALFKDLSDKN